MENVGINPVSSHMQSEHSTIWANLPPQMHDQKSYLFPTILACCRVIFQVVHGLVLRCSEKDMTTENYKALSTARHLWLITL